MLTRCSNAEIVRCLFSATMPMEVEHLAKTFLQDPLTVIIGERNAGADTIEQRLEYVGSEAGKIFALRKMIQEGIRTPVLIFVQSQDRAYHLHKELQFDDINVDYIHAERSQAQTKQVVKNFRLGKLFFLICTDVMARGIDFKGVSCVINYDFPQSTYQYIHRIGRCGRAGRRGQAITFFDNDDINMLRNLAEVMVKSGCHVPDWMLALEKLPPKEIQKKILHPPRRPLIGKDDQRKLQKALDQQSNSTELITKNHHRSSNNKSHFNIHNGKERRSSNSLPVDHLKLKRKLETSEDNKQNIGSVDGEDLQPKKKKLK